MTEKLIIEGFNQLKEHYETVKEQRNAMKERFEELRTVLHDVQLRRHQFVKERIVTMDRHPLYFSRCG